MEYSPKLKTVAAKIQKILQQYNVAGIAFLHTPGHGEYISYLTPDYSCIEIDQAKGTFTVKGKLQHYNGNKELQLKKLNDSANMMNALTNMMAINTVSYMQLTDQVNATYNVEVKPGNHTSHNEQNN